MLISVCLCTYKRDTLETTLRSLEKQVVPKGCEIEVILVDNDAQRSGERISNLFTDSNLNVRYFVNPEKNISAARNSTIENAKGDLLAFLDDDEWAEEDWILSLYNAMDRYKADVVFGRVNVLYPETTPSWIKEADLFGKIQYKTGQVLKKGATSNALIKASWVKEKQLRFDLSFGKCGGEDTDFFHRIYSDGGLLVFENSAIVSELVEADRLNMEYMKRKNIRIGQTHWHYLWSRQTGLQFAKTAVFVVAQILGSGLLLAINFPFGKRRYARWYLRLVRNVVKLKTAFTKDEQLSLYG